MNRFAGAARAVACAGRGRPWRWAYLTVLLYAVVVVAGNLVLTGGILVARLTGNDPRVDDPSFPAIRNLRVVDAKLLAGGQPTNDHFQQLADLGVTLVVDLRTGVPGDPNIDDPGLLAKLGMTYARMPVTDGHAPDDDLVARFVEAVRANDGLVYMHCGGGVGRSTSLQAAYEAATGNDPSILEQLAIGPPTLEQLVYAARAHPGNPSPNNAIIAGFSRWIVDAPRKAVNWVGARV